MSDFEKDYENLHNIKEESSSSSSRNHASGNFDDFERLDGYPIHEQPEAEERETAPTHLAHFDTRMETDEFMQKLSSGLSPQHSPAASGLHSTDRPLVTSGGLESVPVGSSITEATEIHLTPDPEESNREAAEPFVNITANVGEIPVDLGGPRPFFDLDPTDQEVPFDIPHPALQSTHHTEPSAPPEPFSFDPYRGLDEDVTSGGDADLLNFGNSATSEFLMETKVLSDEHHHEEILSSRAVSAAHNVTQEIIKEESHTSELETQSSSHHRSTADDIMDDLLNKSAAGDLDQPKVIPVGALSAKSKMDDSETGEEVVKCMFHPRAWLNRSQLDPRVADLIYWRDVTRSGIVFGASMAVLVPLTYLSFISVVSYLLLAVMAGTLSFRIYKNVIQAVQKTGDGHPFKQYLDCDLSFPKDKVRDGAEIAAKHLECTAQKLRHLFLVEDFVDSIKFVLMLWCFTYIGGWFNGLTLFILAFVALFTLPKVYETYKAQIDHYLNIVGTRVCDTTNKIKAMIPIGKKPKQQ